MGCRKPEFEHLLLKFGFFISYVVFLVSYVGFLRFRKGSVILDELQWMKERSKLSNQQIADLSGVPLTTVQRVLSGSVKNPGYDTVSAIRSVLEKHLPHDEPPAFPSVCPLRFEGLATSDDIVQLRTQYHDTLARIEAQFSSALASKDEQFQKERDEHADRIKSKERWLVRISIVCCALILFIMTVLIVDLANPTIGWFRAAYIKDTISSVWGDVATTLYSIFGV